MALPSRNNHYSKLSSLSFLAFFIASVNLSFAQKQHDSLSVIKSITKGSIGGEQRSYFMQTINKGKLTDWNTLSIGGYLSYESKWYKGWKVRAAYYTSWNTGIGNVWEADPITGKFSRYESGNYDITDTNNNVVHGLGEAKLEYRDAKNQFILGRFKTRTPLLNHQDGRMIPTLFQGAWYQRKGSKMEGGMGFINRIWVRSTGHWENIGNSLQYPQGRSVGGGASDYIGNTDSKFLLFAHFRAELNKHLEVLAWNVYADNMMNTAYLETKYSWKKKLGHQIAFQYIQQNRVATGGNESLQQRYFQNDQSRTYGAQYQVSKGALKFMLNANRISDAGRYAFPRDWGREFLYTFQKRERLEGMQDAWAWSVQAKRTAKLKNKDKFVAMLGYGMYFRPDPTDIDKNRVAMPSNTQLNVDLFYHFDHSIPGLRTELLVVYKGDLGKDWENPNFYINRVDMYNIQLILNYSF